MAERYLALHEKYLQDGSELPAAGDYVQAGEKYWGAVATMIKAVATARGLRHSSHGRIVASLREIAERVNDAELLPLFRSAERLHANFYENVLTASDVELRAIDASRLIDRLRELR